MKESKKQDTAVKESYLKKFKKFKKSLDPFQGANFIGSDSGKTPLPGNPANPKSATGQPHPTSFGAPTSDPMQYGSELIPLLRKKAGSLEDHQLGKHGKNMKRLAIPRASKKSSNVKD